MDYAKLRAAALRDGEAEEAVTVDTRALIDKVLARYSGEWTTLRELIQNAADAQATTVKIKWETLPSTTVPLPPAATGSGSGRSNDLLRHTILHHTLRRLLVENDGQPFTPTDWARLKRIAEGNPDETKIGAFGVGFYSVFADCEEPFVSSGHEAMAFYWKGNALFTRKLVLPADDKAADRAKTTTFVLDYRNATTALPNLLSVSQFLATSLTFVALQHIEFWIDDWKILDLHKKLSPSLPSSVPRDLDLRTKEGLMTVAAVDRCSAQIDATYLHAVSWKPPAASGLSTSAATSAGTSSSAAAAAGSKSTDSYGLSSNDLPSLRSFFSRLAGAASGSSAQKEQRSKAVREEQALQDALQQSLTSQGRATIFLRITNASVQTRVAANFAAELQRATKKPPPKTTKMAILTSSYDDVLASDAASSAAEPAAVAAPADPSLPPPPPYSPRIPPPDIFASVLPSKKPGGRVFIGFPTMQTSGGGMHVSAPSLIPTVEREAIDLNARWVRTWNMELLRVAGILTRVAFVNEMDDLDIKFRRHVQDNRAAGSSTKAVAKGRGGPIPTPAEVAQFVSEALHILKTYTFADSTPSAYVGQIIEEAFWTASKEPSLDIFSSRGVMSTTKVRMGNEEVRKFANGIPVIVPAMKDSPFIKKLHEFGIVQDVTIEDVRSDLESKPLDRAQLVHFVKWIGAGALSGELDPPSVRSLLRVAVASGEDPAAPGGVLVIELRAIQTFLTGNKIPPTLPIPPSTIPFSITSTVPIPHLHSLGWKPLEIVPWLDYLLTARTALPADQDMTQNEPFAAQVLTVVSKNWDNVSAAHKWDIAVALKKYTTMPTRVGMRKPEETFFPSVKLFDDLPTVAPSCQNLKEKLLLALGVRKTVDLDTIFTRLLSPSASQAAADGAKQETGEKGASKNWSHVELIRYLASVHGDIPASDMAKLRDSAFCPAEAGPAGQEASVASTRLYRPSQLFEPLPSVRELGFPILQWPTPTLGSFYRRTTAEGRLLMALGLRMFPSVGELEELMEAADKDRRDKARSYFITNYQTHGYTSPRISPSRKIMPIMGGAGADDKQAAQDEVLVTTASCFYNANAAILGFPILRADLHPHATKFGVYRDPPIAECVTRLLAKPPQDHDEAVAVFAYFATRLADLAGDSLVRLRKGAFVPVTRRPEPAPVLNANGFPDEKKSGQRSTTTVKHMPPTACYLGSATTYGDIFDFVDFGVDGNAFLFKCGCRNEPTKAEIANLACTEPARLLSTLQTTERYLSLLRSLAEDLPQLKKDRELFRKMRSSPFLLASREIGRQAPQAAPRSGFGNLFQHVAGAAGSSGADDADAVDAEDDQPPIRQYRLAEPSKISVLDDYISYRLFKDKLLCAPEEDALEAFYLALGAQMLSKTVQEDIRVGPLDANQDQAEKLRKFVLERSKIFLHEYQRYRQDATKHDIRWLEKNLRVRIVQSVSLQRTLRSSFSESHTEKRFAASTRVPDGYVLYISSQSRVDMYQVGQAVCQLVLSRPSQQAYFFFEPFLKLELLDLRARGYNVDRILRAKAAEARVAEEERRKALAAEQERIQATEREWAAQQQRALTAGALPEAKTPERDRKSKVPGAFDDDSSPVAATNAVTEDANRQELELETQKMAQNAARRSRGLFSTLTRRLGLERDDQDGTGASLGQERAAAAIADEHHRHSEESERRHGGSGGGSTLGSDDSDGRVTSPAAVQQNMLNAIQATRPYGSSSVYQPPQATAVKEQSSYCDRTYAQDIAMIAQAPRGMNVFLARAVSTPAATFLSQSRAVIAAFESLLFDVAGVYGLDPAVVHMYYDTVGPTIAFNINGSIFCNLRYFLQLHAQPILGGGGGGGSGGGSPQARVDATVWWWVVVAHELAHNLESNHNQNHSYYTESFVQQYFHKMTAQAAALAGRASDGGRAGNGDGDGGGSLSLAAPPSYEEATSALQQRGPSASLLD